MASTSLIGHSQVRLYVASDRAADGAGLREWMEPADGFEQPNSAPLTGRIEQRFLRRLHTLPVDA